MLIKRLDHVNIRTADLRATVAFYRDILELEERDPSPNLDKKRIRWMYDQHGDPIVHISTADSLSVYKPDEIGAGSTGGIDHIAFQCVGIHALIERLNQVGISWRENRVEPIGLTQVFLHDPNGVKIELNILDHDLG